MATLEIGAQIADIVQRWEGVEIVPHRFGGMEFRVEHREMGHLHGSRLVDLPFPLRMRRALVAAGRAEPHHVLPKTGWVSLHIRSEHDIPAVIELLRLNYDRLRHGAENSAVRQVLGSASILGDRSVDDLPA